jgi:hypothetical protein
VNQDALRLALSWPQRRNSKRTGLVQRPADRTRTGPIDSPDNLGRAQSIDGLGDWNVTDSIECSRDLRCSSPINEPANPE